MLVVLVPLQVKAFKFLGNREVNISHLSHVNWTVVVAQLAERYHPTPEDLGSIQVISNFYKEHLFSVSC